MKLPICIPIDFLNIQSKHKLNLKKYLFDKRKQQQVRIP